MTCHQLDIRALVIEGRALGLSAREMPMPRYFIETDDGDQIHYDTTGHDLPDAASARKTVLDSLPDMARDKMPDGDTRTIVGTARDQNGDVVYVATLTLKGAWGPSFPRGT